MLENTRMYKVFHKDTFEVKDTIGVFDKSNKTLTIDSRYDAINEIKLGDFIGVPDKETSKIEIYVVVAITKEEYIKWLILKEL